jgi:hypothetical protein
MLRLLIL